MASIAYILLCHKDPEAIVAQALRLTAKGDYIAIHFDARAPRGAYAKIKSALAENANVTFAKRRVKCGWGEWSLVEATLLALQSAVASFPNATHFYMLSGDCMPIKSAAFAHDFLDAEDADYIECFDFFRSDWIKTGMKSDRLLFRHFFNERKTKFLFYASVNIQRRFGLQRKIPSDLEIMIGSQWWCLRRGTVEKILKFTKDRPDVIRFFRRTWIPDETFFQTLVPHLISEEEIRCRTLTFLLFSDYGMPVNFYDDHYNMLTSQDYIFARKISSEAMELKRRLGELYANDAEEFAISNEGANLFRFLVARGRIGRRFAPRFWETESTMGRERKLFVLICKKWHVGKRVLEQIRAKTGLAGVEYLFDEEVTELPDLGGIEGSIEKRTRHRRSLMRMLFDYYETDQMVVCLDPNNLDLMRDFHTDRSMTRFLEIECTFTDDYLVGHAKRVGLAGERTSTASFATLLPTIRRDVVFESDQIRDAGFSWMYRIKERGTTSENAQALAEFLEISHDDALEITADPKLFRD
jgi:hypothetical protein